ncbi:hypothetical protein BOO86_04640 [Mycobacterium sp. CBMA 234]|uniref:hypothetical protein n=1 Tax=Mycolicibacterium sp. CBMA 234 TaxID=1918495 RepID=UPI0012DD23AA|nr:hypothetical protein [Mycolicibacterium sp. CBMA 234]MUL63743.1 hypothetical protein [Mycolicibacterium sp. CBMA 234]
MSVGYAEYESNDDIRLVENITWRDSDTACTVVLSQPNTDPELWHRYLDSAERNYRRHGVEAVVDAAAIRSGADTALFWTVMDHRGNMVGGLRAKAPLGCADDSHAVVEWHGQPGLAMVRKMIDDRAPFGVLEMKTAWVSDHRASRHSITHLLARTAFHATSVMGVQFVMATAAQHVLELWKSGGGVVAPIPATPYPDERYRTKMMWWDRRTMINHSEPEQVSKALHEIGEISTMLVAS